MFLILLIVSVGWFSLVADVSTQQALQTYDGHTTEAISGWVVVVDVGFLFFFFEFVVRISAMSGSRELTHRAFRYLFVEGFIVFVCALEMAFTLGCITPRIIRNLLLLKLVRFCELRKQLKHIRLFGKLVRTMSACVQSAEDLFSMLLLAVLVVFAIMFLQFVTESVA